jgi:hypothetical protein
LKSPPPARVITRVVAKYMIMLPGCKNMKSNFSKMGICTGITLIK